MSEFRIKVSVDLDVKDVKSQLKELDQDYKIKATVDMSKINQQIISLRKNFKEAFRFTSKDLGGLDKLIKTLAKINGSTQNNGVKEISDLVTKYKDLGNTVEKLQKQLSKGGLGEDSIKRTQTSISELKAEMDKLYSKMTDKQKDSVGLFEFKNANKNIVDLYSNLNKIETQLNKLEGKSDGIKIEFLSKDSLDELNKIQTTIEEIRTEAKNDIKLEVDVGNALNQINDVNDSLNRLQKEAKENEKAISKSINSQVKKSTNGMLGTWDDFTGNFAQFTLAEVAGDFLSDAIRGVVGTVTELDAAFTNLRKVSDTPIDGAFYESIKSQAIETAKEVGMSSADVVNSIATAMQMGAKNIEEAMAIAEQSMILANVGDMSSDMASDAVATIINSYNLDPLREMQIQQKGTIKTTNELTNAMDMLNHASNNYAIDSAGLSSALASVGSVLNAYGISLGDSIGLITATNESIGDPDKVATGLKSIGINLAGLQTSAKDGTITLNKTAMALGEIAGIDIYSDKKTGQIKDMTVILDELQAKWHTLSEEEQYALSNAIAGKTNAAVFQALMGNYETFKQIQNEFNEGMHFGSAAEENAQYIDSIAGKLNKLKETWTSIITAFAKSDLIKGALDIFIKISEVIEKIASNDGLSALALGITGLFAGISKLGKIGRISDLFEVGGTVKDIATMTTSTGGLFSNFKNGIKVVKNAATSLGLFGSVGATATTLIGAGLLGLIGYVIAYDKYQTAATKKRMDERRENIKSLEQELATEKQKIESAKSIANEYDKLRSKTNLTAAEQERYLELTRQVAELFPELVSGYDENGDPILKLNGSLLTYIGNLDKAYEKQQKLLDSEENDQADEWEEREKELKADKWNANEGNLKPTGVPSPSLATNGSNDYARFDAKKYLNTIKEFKENEEAVYKERLKIYEEYETAIAETREKYRNQMHNDSYYKNMGEQDKAELDAMMDNVDLYSNVDPDEAKEFTKEIAKQKDTIVSTTEEMGEHADEINKLEEAYANGEITLREYEEGMMKIYETAGKVDNESFGNLMAEIDKHASINGLESVQGMLNDIGDTMEEITGIDDDLWAKVLTPNIEPLEDAQKRLNNFLKSYGTGAEHLGKGGLADKLEKEWQAMNDLPEEIAKEYQEKGEISVEFLLNATVDSPTPIKDLVGEFVKDGEITDQELYLLLEVISMIQNGEELTPELEQQLRDYLPDEYEDEIINNLKVKTDVKNEQEIDDFLKTRDELSSDVECEIRMHVDSVEEAEEVYNIVKSLPEEQRLTAVSNYGKIKDDAYKAGKSIDDIPKDLLIKATVNMDSEQVDMFSQAVTQLDGKQVTTFLQQEGAIEALQECESVQQMMDLINGKKTLAEIRVENGDAEEKTKTTKTSLESVEGEYKADLMVQTDTSDLEYVEGQIYEIDGKNYMCVFNVDTNKKELVEFNGEIKSIPEEKNSKVTVEADSSGVEEAKTNVEAIGDVKVQPEVIPVVKEDTAGGGIFGKLKSLFGGKNNSQTVEVTAKVSEVDTSSLSSVEVDPIETKARVSEVDLTVLSSIPVDPIKVGTEVDMSSITTAQSTINSIQDKTVKILADSSNAMSKISNVTSGLTSIKDKTVKILADSSNAMMKIANVKSGLAGIKDKTVKILADSSNAMLKINNVKNALATLSSKTISLNVNKTVTETVVKKSLPEAPTQMLSNSSLASVPVSASASLSDATVTASDTPSLANATVTASANSFGGTLDANKILKSLDFDISHIKDLEEALKRLEGQLDLIDKKSEVTFGQEKVNLLQQQIPLLKQQQQIQEQIAKNERAQNNELIYWLNNKGFTFDSLGNILNYNNKLLQMEQNVESLKKKYDSLNSASEKNESAVKSVNEAYESANEELSKTKKYLEEYFATNNQEITEASQKWWEYEASIKAVNEELEELRRITAIEPLKNSLQEIDYLLDRQSDRLDLLETQYENVSGAEKVEYLVKKEKLLNEQLQTQEEAYKRIYNLAKGLQNDLWKYGFKVDENSLISNYDEVLNSLVGTEQYELAKEYADEYMEIVREDLIDIQKEAYETKNAISSMAEEMQEALAEAREQRLEPFKNTLQQIEYELDRVADKLELLDATNERSKGKTNIDYLYNKINILNEQIATSQKEFDALYNLIAESQEDLWKYGFRVDESSLISNYDDVLGELVGTEKYEEAKNIADEYMDLMRDNYIENKLSIIEVQNEVKELQDEIAKAERELALFSSTNRLTELNEEFEELSHKLDVIDSKLEYAFGTDKVNLMREEVELLNKQLEVQADKIKTTSSQMQVYTNDLSKYGFTFGSDGLISNYAEVMEVFRDDEQVENIKELCEEYMDLRDEVNNLSSEYANLENAVKDAYNEMLDTTKDIESELTDIIKKEYEDRTKEVEKYTDERIKLLNKEKQAMQELWDNQDYEKSVDEQAKEISDLQKRINILTNDTSIAGRQKLKELTEELEEAQKKLEELTEDKIRDDYSNNIDKEIEKLEEEEQTILDALDEKFSDVNIAKKVQEALTSGFMELNGEMQSIQDVLLNSINESADAYSIMSEVIKNQLIANLNVALNTTKELSSIYKELDLNEYGKISALENVTIASPERVSGSNNISIGDTIFNVSGSADNTTLEQVEEMIKQSQEEMLDKITKDL